MRKYYLIFLFIFSFSILSYSENEKFVPVILEVDSEDVLNQIIKDGGEVWHRRDELALVLIPVDASEKLRKSGNYIPREGRRMQPAMNLARQWYEADVMASAKGLNQPYTGKGVVVGFCDTGFDPMHINFLDSDGKSRVKKMVCYNEPMGERIYLAGDDDYKNFVTDNADNWHATHVCGIMAGSYRDNGYYGMAPDADIVATTSNLYDVGILAGAEEVIAYAKSVGKPAVINMSLSSYTGPHDGSSLFSRYLAKLGEEAIICMAAGNEGNSLMSYRLAADANVRIWQTRFRNSKWNQFEMKGMVDAWASNSEKFQISLLIFDEVSGTVVASFGPFGDDEQFREIIKSETHPEFAQYFSGYVQIEGALDNYNMRRYAEMSFDAKTEEIHPNSGGKYARYNLAMRIEAPKGVGVDICSDAHRTFMMGWSGWPAASGVLSTSDIASGDNCLCVGMFANRDKVTYLSGNEYNFKTPPGLVSPYSSYGTLLDGRIMPHTVAPGDGVISSVNSAYSEKYPEIVPTIASQEIAVGDKKYYWATMTGTSMSTPYVAGSIACWLEANQNLGIDDVKEIIAKTNREDYPDLEDPRNGEGRFDPYVGLLNVLGVPGIVTDIEADSKIRMTYEDKQIKICNPAKLMCEVIVCSLEGANQKHFAGNRGDLTVIGLQDFPSGAYIISLKAETGEVKTMKIII